MLEDRPEYRDLVAANRILAKEGVVDAFGHVSLRHPERPDRYVLARSLGPALVTLADLMEFEQDGTPVDQRGRAVYLERMIHGAIYEARPDVTAVVHSHAAAVLPFAVTKSTLRPLFHLASGMGRVAPVWDIRDTFGDTDLLVRDMAQGRDLARTLGASACLLMRGHGAVVAGPTLKAAVITAVYLQVNATVQLAATQLGEPTFLSDGEIAKAAAATQSPVPLDRAWEYLCLRAGAD